MRTLTTTAALMVAIAGASTTSAAPLDPAAAEALMRKSGCFKCHAPEKKKDGPPYKEIAAKYKGKPEAEAKLIERLEKGDKVKIDGKEEDHDPIKTKDREEVKSAVKWILSK